MSESQNVRIATDENFQNEIENSDDLALVDFWAEWCGPCKMLGPTIDQLADDYQGKVKVYKMNVDENPQTPAKFQVRGIPTVVLIKKGQLVEQVVGVQPKEGFASLIDKHLS